MKHIISSPITKTKTHVCTHVTRFLTSNSYLYRLTKKIHIYINVININESYLGLPKVKTSVVKYSIYGCIVYTSYMYNEKSYYILSTIVSYIRICMVKTHIIFSYTLLLYGGNYTAIYTTLYGVYTVYTMFF